MRPATGIAAARRNSSTARTLHGVVRLVPVLVVVIALAAVLCPVTAQAAQVRVTVRCDKGDCADGFVFHAAAGERNDLTISAPDKAVVFTDPGATITAAAVQCRSITPHEVACSPGISEFTQYVEAHAGDLDDRVDASPLSDTPAEIYGDDGADTLLGGHSGEDNVIEGGSGSDAMTGGPGLNEVSYADHGTPVRVDLARGTARGAGGELDQLSDLQKVRGGSGDDVLRGDAGPNILIGGSGDDVLLARAGNDSLAGEAGADRLLGGSGDDQLDTSGAEAEGAGPDFLACGTGRDTVEQSGRRQTISDDCEVFTAGILTTRLHVAHRDARRDIISVPLDYPGTPFALDARITTISGRLLGRLHRNARVDYDRHRAVLHLTRAGAAYVASHRPLSVVYRDRRTQPRGYTYRSTVRLRLH